MTAFLLASHLSEFLLLITGFSLHLLIQLPQRENLIGQLTSLWVEFPGVATSEPASG